MVDFSKLIKKEKAEPVEASFVSEAPAVEKSPAFKTDMIPDIPIPDLPVKKPKEQQFIPIAIEKPIVPEIVKTPEEELAPEETALAISKPDTPLAQPLQGNFLPSEDVILAQINRLKFLKKNLVDKSDYTIMEVWNSKTKKTDKKPSMNKSGYRKLLIGFNISIDLVEKRYFKDEGDIHAEAIVKATLSNGQSMIGLGIKSASEYGKKKWCRHDLEATAMTRAVNRAIGDLVGIGEVSYEELYKGG